MSRFESYIIESEIKKVGVVGFSDKKFDKSKAKQLLIKGFEHFGVTDKDEIVSGLTDLGIPSISYRIAKDQNIKTIGIACKLAKDFKLYPVDKKIIVGNDWGDESPTFLKYITHMIKVGGGLQSEKEYKNFKGPKVEYKLDEL